MKQLIILLLAVSTFSANAQNGRIINLTPIESLEGTPIYSKLTIEKNGERVYKPKFQYLENVSISKLVYESDGLEITGMMVRPKTEGTYPCIVFNRGGNRSFGKLLLGNAVMFGMLANEGYIVVASNYRGSNDEMGSKNSLDEFGGKDVNDVINIIEALENIEGADTERIGMYGWSRGAMMTYLALTKTNKIKAAVAGAGNADLTQIDRENMETGVYEEIIPNYMENKVEELEKRSAVFWADKFPKDVPLLLLHGNADWRVQSKKSLQLALELDKYRVPYKLIIFEGGDHSLSEHKDEVNQEVIDWFDKYVKENSTLPNVEFHGQ